MTLRRRILLFYSITLCLSLVMVCYWSYYEFTEQRDLMLQRGKNAAFEESPLHETLEILLIGGVPALLVGIVGGGILMRRALRPIKDLTSALEQTDISNLSEPVERSGNGDELDRMTTVFNRMKERLGFSFTQAREFTLHASHELKTPLTIIHATLEQMLVEGGASSTVTQHDRVASMLEEVQRLSTIVGQLEFLAKADAGLLSRASDEVALHDLVRDLTEDVTILAANAGITVQQTECMRAIVVGDRMRLRQLLLNLADNAVKYNRPGGSILLSLINQGDRTVFRIANTGHALAEEYRSRVFERFFRGDLSHSSEVEGSGLGLSIAESITRAHQGTLDFEVLEDGQTQLTLTLPRVQTVILRPET